ncbi:phage terminase large subunit family protein [Prosthecomicrobium sp. N25]|uniref:phage terminase large subunit family protein n=1 Tax=Prosthecomicrobium sp. N25 TaxID=3129254 RepID=UPI003076974D
MRIDDVWRLGLAPDPQMSVAEWAERYRILPGTAGEPGPWRNARTPYMVGVMDALSVGSPFERVVVMAAAQTAKTEAALNFIGSIIHLTPGTTLFVQPTDSAAKRATRTRIDPMIEATPDLRERVAKRRGRNAGNTDSLKTFPGGALVICGANSPVNLRSLPARFVLLDEVDAYPADVGGEGDAIDLAVARTVTFRGRRKILLTSTPTVDGASRIQAAFEEGDQRRFYIPCPSCDETTAWSWDMVRWPEGRPEAAHMVCPHCGGVIEEREKPRLLALGEWRATAPGDGRTASFHVPGVLSPFKTWAELAADQIAAGKDPTRLQVFTNTGLGLPWLDAETGPLTVDALLRRAVDADPPWIELLPERAAVITAGVDVQDDRLECEFIGWGRGEESWSLDYAVLAGDTTRPEVWHALDRLLLRRFRHPRAVPDLPVAAVAIDHGGHRSAEVSRFSAERLQRRVWAVKGRGGDGIPPWPRRPPKARRGALAAVHVVGVDGLKHQLFGRLRSADPHGPGAIHIPGDREEWWHAGILAERPIREWRGRVARVVWLADRNVRNEPLDARVYAIAALHGLYASGFSLDDAAARIAAALPRAVAEPKTAMAPRVIRSSWLDW